MSFRQIKSFDLSDYDFEEINIEEYEKLAKDATLLKDVFQDVNKLVLEARGPLEEIDSKTDDCIDYVQQGNVQLIKAVKSNKVKNTIIITTIASVLGVCIGGPIGGGAAAGISTVAIGFATISSILGGAVVGGITGAGTLGSITGIFYNICKK